MVKTAMFLDRFIDHLTGLALVAIGLAFAGDAGGDLQAGIVGGGLALIARGAAPSLATRRGD
jgi:hypothetical protein